MSELSIKVTIANRVYPLTVKRNEEEGIRKSARMINEKIKEYESKYAVKDKQDLLAMYALELASVQLDHDENKDSADTQIRDELNKLNNALKEVL